MFPSLEGARIYIAKLDVGNGRIFSLDPPLQRNTVEIHNENIDFYSFRSSRLQSRTCMTSM